MHQSMAWALGRRMQGRTCYPGVQPADPLTFESLALVMALVLFTVGYLPAHRAAPTDPAAALRAQ